MVDEARVQRLLRHLVDTIGYLESEAGADADASLRAQRRWLDSIKYNFITAIECAVDVGQHICATQGWGPPSTNVAVFDLLGIHGVLTRDTAANLMRANGSRNVLVHNYVEVREDLVIANLDRLTDLRIFATAVATWLAQA